MPKAGGASKVERASREARESIKRYLRAQGTRDIGSDT